ncbi:conserved hypothetical protein [Leishmania major strain Friedlin]|uniref:Uncharacterized protein n=1 Tax=Leishmania major TaxID=5664 RepID=Q4QG64_LEIMA|nr:conserved hypothetical protein [Leishmania major strain Friedlin]CAG9571033.1 hypothetical_protein_-_conserved [Leishmania major strain Friedlin]CAJ02834.1 conserved hypothetical protein [Leishmania major strain Friedlin]|eukprot:XP_001681834.1 conserved hypothetical protein [Leishmania major strain Friedlin]
MPRNRSSGDDGGGGGKRGGRYAAVVEKGENAWKREWSSFMSGVNLKRLRDGTSGVTLKASADIERQLVAREAAPSSSSVAGEHDNGNDVEVNADGIPLGAIASHASFSYLFSSPAERRAERDARERAEAERRQAHKRELMAKKDPLSVLSKHQRAMHNAEQRGLQLDGMTRKERRSFLHLTVTEAQRKAEEQSREFKLHDLMDEKLAWYQQGPHPIDLIAEKLVRRKAEKKGKQLGLKYNYLAPHPSWLAKRAQRRRESLLVGLGKRLIFLERVTGEDKDDATTVPSSEVMVTDPLHHLTVPLSEMGRLLGQHGSASLSAAAAAAADADALVTAAAGSSSGDDIEDVKGADEEGAQHLGGEVDRGHRGDVTAARKKAVSASSAASSAGGCSSASPGKRASGEAGDDGVGNDAAQMRLPDVVVLQDPSRIATSLVRTVARDRTTALAIQQINRTTNFLSSGLVKGPSLRPEDALPGNGLSPRGLGAAPAAAALTPSPKSSMVAASMQDSAANSTKGAATTSRGASAAGRGRRRVRVADGEEEGGERRRHRRGADVSAGESQTKTSKPTASPSPRPRGARPPPTHTHELRDITSRSGPSKSQGGQVSSSKTKRQRANSRYD